MGLNGVGSLWSDTWAQYTKQFAVLAEILLLPSLVMVLGYVLLALGMPLFTALGGLVVFLGAIFLTYSVLPLIYAIHHGTGVDASYKATLAWFWPFIWVTILEVLAVWGGFVMLIIPGIWLAFALGLMRYVFVVENRRGIDALRQSRDYVKGYWWAFVGRALLVGLATAAIVFVFDIPFSAFAGHLAGSIVSLLVSVVAGPFSAIYVYLIYQNLRTLKPEVVAMERTKEGTGFIKASAIVGLVAGVIAIFLILLAVALGIAATIRGGGHLHVSTGTGSYGTPMIPAPAPGSGGSAPRQ